jgi:hypothetical protein
MPKFNVYLYEKPIDLTKSNKPYKKGLCGGYSPAIVAKRKMKEWNFSCHYVFNIDMKKWFYEGNKYILKLEEIEK